MSSHISPTHLGQSPMRAVLAACRMWELLHELDPEGFDILAPTVVKVMDFLDSRNHMGWTGRSYSETSDLLKELGNKIEELNLNDEFPYLHRLLVEFDQATRERQHWTFAHITNGLRNHLADEEVNACIQMVENEMRSYDGTEETEPFWVRVLQRALNNIVYSLKVLIMFPNGLYSINYETELVDIDYNERLWEAIKDPFTAVMEDALKRFISHSLSANSEDNDAARGLFSEAYTNFFYRSNPLINGIHEIVPNSTTTFHNEMSPSNLEDVLTGPESATLDQVSAAVSAVYRACAICYDMHESGRETNNCRHFFCDECLQRHLDSRKNYRYTCPLCRTKFFN